MLGIKHEDDMTPGQYRRWQRDQWNNTFPQLCDRCCGELHEAACCSECNGSFHLRCFHGHKCLVEGNDDGVRA